MPTSVITSNNYNVTPASKAHSTVSSSSTNDPNSVAAQQDTFLKLLVTQMQNQDPLNPMDNSQMTSQIAQLNTVQGINKLNTTVAALQTQLQASQNLQSTSFIGRIVLAPGSSLSLTNGSAQMGVDLASASDSTMIQIKDINGSVVRTFGIGAGVAGTNQITWDGKNDAGQTMPDGQYKFAVSASANNQQVQAATLAYSLVNSVSMSSTGVKLNTNHSGDVDVNSVRLVK
ncbi:basal-body rod modification protein FlgD [Polynucleobacter sp. SHI8]|uniref:flagellar hook assembly protein FlgD n=1 Tax=unclassified Polynucleobacter TaxID=2640945 RepID=UPI0024902CED|nr:MULTISPECIES: flagellar hook assembly protein FlgD [unclassified Polynucleobacter]BDW11775.1 basal-body rod modification protein FlgD [Polynucleobacter sp. SHI2]BDW14222.1 basal-body rod modification protein FlgD [Polynucleobacter sp. SHI8]